MIAKSRKAVKDEKKYNLLANSNTTPPENNFKKCERSACFHVKFSLWCIKGKAFCEGPFSLHRSLPEKQNVDIARPWKNVCGRPCLEHFAGYVSTWLRNCMRSVRNKASICSV